MKSKVFFTRDLSPEGIERAYKALGMTMSGKVAVKVHSGEKGNQNYLRPEFSKKLINDLKGTVVECNTAYAGARNTTPKHTKLMQEHGWTKYYNVDIMDADGDVALPVIGGKVIKENYVGKNLLKYDSLVVLSHFKGHPMGGFGGALKQLSIGCASTVGKCWIHSAGKVKDQNVLWDNIAEQNDFIDAMAEAAGTVSKLFAGKAAYINVMCNMSVDCDCCAVAEDPCLKDVGILASTDPVAIDQACIDIVYSSDDRGREHFVQRVESRNGKRILDTAASIGVGSKDYELIDLDAR